MANYTSDFSGQHNDEYDERISSLNNKIIALETTILTLEDKINQLESLTTGTGFTGTWNIDISGSSSSAITSTYAGWRWSATTAGATWSRLCHITAGDSGTSGFSGILHINCTRANVVCNASFILNVSHTTGFSHIVQLNSNSYTVFQIRLVTNTGSDTYIEVYDNAQSLSSSGRQGWNCHYIPLTRQNFTPYSSFTSGASIPSGYSATSTKSIKTGGGIVTDV